MFMIRHTWSTFGLTQRCPWDEEFRSEMHEKSEDWCTLTHQEIQTRAAQLIVAVEKRVFDEARKLAV